MSYCRWSTPIPELTPDVDLSWEKMMEVCPDGGYELWAKYMEDNNVVMSDAYVYESEIGFVCHWANRFDEENATNQLANAQSNVEGMWCETATEMAEYLTKMREQGFRVPESAIQALKGEQEDDMETESWLGTVQSVT